MSNAPAKKTRKTKRSRIRRRVWPRWAKPALVAGTVVAVLGTVGGGGWWGWQAGLSGPVAGYALQTYRDVNRAAGLVVREVLVEGRSETPRSKLLEALRVARGDLILEIDVAVARERLKRIGWIAEARVERRLPDTIRVALVERVPIAIWQHEDKFLLVDRVGAVIGPEEVERFPYLKVLVGDDAPRHAEALLAMLRRQPNLMERVSAAVRTGGRRWNLRMDNGIDVRLPEEDPFAAWDRLARYERAHGLLERDIRTIDLRIPNRVVVRVNQEKAPEESAPGHRT